MNEMNKNSNICFLCGLNISKSKFIHEITRKPKNETDFGIDPENYSRRIYQCRECDVYCNIHNMLPKNLYDSNYNKATYQSKMLYNYNKILNMDASKSDNKQRVKRVLDFLEKNHIKPSQASILDVGSGLCVFLGEMQKHIMYRACIDPDKASVEHAIKNALVDKAFNGTLLEFKSNRKYNLISFNKVLEHVDNPVDILKKSKDYLKTDGFVYIELPNGDSALKSEGVINREEFFIDHKTIFTKKSIGFLANKAGFTFVNLNNIHEPSDKFTIYGFLKQK